MTYRVEPMQVDDIPEIMAIERQSFTESWPARAYRREVEENRFARYVVVRDCSVILAPEAGAPGGVLHGLVSGVRHLLGHNMPDAPIVGYLGLWLMVDEAHITTVAVHPNYRRQGIGELLLIAAVRMSLELEARLLTLEVRRSNVAAQALYRKFGFTITGVRRRYYSDNHEDALIMSTDCISDEQFLRRFYTLVELSEQKTGQVAWYLPVNHSTTLTSDPA